MGIPVGSTDAFPLGQCTYWADYRYHQLTGKYIPWGGDAWVWLKGARSSNWNVTDSPPMGIPSIIILQPGVQGAGPLGHVAFVENVNADGSVTTSNMNWGSTPSQRTSVQYIRFHPGNGVSFAWFPTNGVQTMQPSPIPVFNQTATANISADWLTQLRSEGIKIGIFLMAFVLFLFGIYLLFTKQVNTLVKAGVKGAVLG